MYRSGLVDTLVTHANMKGLGLTPLFGDRHGFMPPQLKTTKTNVIKVLNSRTWLILKTSEMIFLALDTLAALMTLAALKTSTTSMTSKPFFLQSHLQNVIKVYKYLQNST